MSPDQLPLIPGLITAAALWLAVIILERKARRMIRHGPGAYADPDAKPERWGGRKAQQYVERTLAEYGDVCIICGRPGSDSADHVIPRADGGAVYDLANLGPAHRPCNYSRGRRPLRPIGIPIESGLAFFKP